MFQLKRPRDFYEHKLVLSLKLPFAFAHEIGHVIHGDQHTTAKTKLAKKQEKAADLYAVGLIWGYCLKMGIDPTTCGIPTRYI